MPSIVTSPIPQQDTTVFPDTGDEEFLDRNEQGGSEEAAEIVDTEQTPASPDQTFSRWFGRHDATTVSFYGELRTSENGDATELHIGGTALSELLEPEDLPSYTVFLHDLLRGHAAWQGEELPDGTVREGCLAVRQGEMVELTYGSQLSRDNGVSITNESMERSAPFVPDSQLSEEILQEPAVVSLDDVLAQQSGEIVEEFEDIAHAA